MHYIVGHPFLEIHYVDINCASLKGIYQYVPIKRNINLITTLLIHRLNKIRVCMPEARQRYRYCINSRASTRLGATFSYHNKSRPLFRVNACAVQSWSAIRCVQTSQCTDVVTVPPSASVLGPRSHQPFRRRYRSEPQLPQHPPLIALGRMRGRRPLSSNPSMKTPAQRKVRPLLTCVRFNLF